MQCFEEIATNLVRCHERQSEALQKSLEINEIVLHTGRYKVYNRKLVEKFKEKQAAGWNPTGEGWYKKEENEDD